MGPIPYALSKNGAMLKGEHRKLLLLKPFPSNLSS